MTERRKLEARARRWRREAKTLERRGQTGQAALLRQRARELELRLQAEEVS